MSTLTRNTRARDRRSPSKCATRACDQCKLRKTKCTLSRPCGSCLGLGFECTFMTPQKKRGPPAHRVAQIRQQQATSPQNTAPDLTYMAGTGSGAGSPVIVPPSQSTHLKDQPGAQSDNTAPLEAAWNPNSGLDYWLPENSNWQGFPLFGFQGSNIFINQSLPPIIEENVNVDIGLSNQTPILDTENPLGLQTQPDLWPSYINDASIIPWIDVYFDRLHPTLPVLNRSSLFTRIVQQEHRRNRQFGALILSLCAFSLTQPIDINERPTSASREDQAKVLVNEATRMRTSPDFGENPSIEAVLTSFFLFGYLFGSNQHNAARLRLREAMDLASTLGLNNPATYANCSTEQKGLWLRTYLVLSVTERAYALQRQHPITFTGRPLDIIRAADEIRNATQRVVSGIIVHTEKDAAGMMGLALLMEIFDAIDQDILICWNARCNASVTQGRCQILTESRALSIFDNLARVGDPSRYKSNVKNNDRFDPDFNDSASSHEQEQPNATRSQSWWRQCGTNVRDQVHTIRDFLYLSETQCADILVTQKWVQDRLWNLCFSHGLLSQASNEGPGNPALSLGYAVENANQALELCRLLRISAIEAHGVGIIEKLYNVATSALLATKVNLGQSADAMNSQDPYSIRVLAETYLKLMKTLRGGNHPYLAPYEGQLVALGLATAGTEMGS